MDINFFETSAKNSINVELAFKTLIADIMKNIDPAKNLNNNIKVDRKTNEKKSCCLIS
jgi:hypothetical protein